MNKFQFKFLIRECLREQEEDYCSANFTIQEFSKCSQKYIEVFKKKGNTGNRYKFPNDKTLLMKHLYNVDEPYYRYIHQLEDDFVPRFNGEPKKDEEEDEDF